MYPHRVKAQAAIPWLRVRRIMAVMLKVEVLGTVERSVGSICHSRGCDLSTEPGI